MKLIFCPHCEDIIKLGFVPRFCECGKSSGFYLKDRINAVISGSAIPLGIANYSFSRAIRQRPNDGEGERFEAFVIPEICPTIEKK